MCAHAQKMESNSRARAGGKGPCPVGIFTNLFGHFIN
jgi:hypothetical protein